MLTTLKYNRVLASLYSEKVLKAFLLLSYFVSLPLALSPLNMLIKSVVMFFINTVFLLTQLRCDNHVLDYIRYK